MGFQENMRAEITGKIVKSLETGVAPWRKPWTGGGLPVNLVSRKHYRGINTLLLAIHQWQHNLTSNVYATFNQWKEAGCMVKKRPDNVPQGGYGANIIFFTPIKGEKMQPNGETKEFTFPLMRSYTVFNADQVEGGAELVAKRFPPVAKTPADVHDEAERVIGCYTKAEGLQTLNSDKAAYVPNRDILLMPQREAFTMGANSYYGTYFHECVHSTGADKRLKRCEKFARFGTEAYAMEELVAEIGGCYLLGAVGLPVLSSLENHASYVENWLRVLKGDHKAIFQASAAAAAAADFVLKPSGLLDATDAEAAEPALV
jgi:antirestriction protein ArdC